MMAVLPSDRHTQAYLDATRQPDFIITVVVLMVSAVIAVALRVLARRVRNVKLGKDDYTMFLALVSSLNSMVY